MNMKFGLQGLVAVSGLMMAAAALAQVPADAPSGTTGLCKDGTYVSAETKKGACKGHKGIKTWYAADTKKTPAADAKGAAPAAAATPAATPAPAAASAATPAAAPATTKSKTAMPATAAPGGGPGLVWLNTSTKVYHCQGDKWYGKTKAGEYLSEADAKAKGAHAEGGKACS